MQIKILFFFAWLFSWIFNIRIIKIIKKGVNKTISFSIQRNLKSHGKNFRIDYPFDEIQGLQFINVGNNVHFHSNIRLEAVQNFREVDYTPEIRIGNNVIINNYCHIGIIDSLIIEDNVLIASKVFITDHFHGSSRKDDMNAPPAERVLYSRGKVHIEKNVWIGENVSILPGVTIGENSVIGANSVVTKNIAKNSVAGGNPATLIRKIIT